MTNRQGHSTSTALTNRSKFITVILDKRSDGKTPKNNDRNSDFFKLLQRGARPMHQTTYIHQQKDLKPNITTTYEAFKGKRYLSPSKRPDICPSQHVSQISFGQDFAIIKDKKQQLDQLRRQQQRTFEDKRRWKVQMSGNNMLKSMVHDLDNNIKCPNYTQNRPNNNSSGIKESQKIYPKKVLKSHLSYNIINGITSEVPTRTNFKLTSGNKFIYNSPRKNNDQAPYCVV